MKSIKEFSDHPLFDHATEEKLDSFESICEHRSFEDGDRLIEEGDPPSGVFLILNGTVDIVKGEKDVFVKKLARGEIFGEMSVFTNETTSASVEASGEVEVLECDQNRFNQFLDENPSFGLSFLRRIITRLCQRLRDTTDKLVDLKSYELPISNDELESLLDAVDTGMP